ncbi:MAG: ADP-ribosylglycohydrolase family protein [Elusimicrobiota bacterium]|nr:ADP-ribosylglycohydrolase family protein [Elusimicrobiota bacterium]
MLGAIAGDIIGSPYEFDGFKEKDFQLFPAGAVFTDDTVLTAATAEALLTGIPYAEAYRKWGRKYIESGFGTNFYYWLLEDDAGPYNSWGNGSAMRVSPAGWVFSTIEETLNEAKKSAEVTHNHPEGIKGAQATAAAIFLGRRGKSKEEIREYIEEEFNYGLSTDCDEIRPDYGFEVSCQDSVPEAIIAFLDSENFEDAVRLAVSLGGDSDTQGAIAGSIAEAYYGGVPEEIKIEVYKKLPDDIREVVEKFRKKVLE